jgi:enoyl ACP reductase
MGLLDGKRLLVTGVITDASIAYSVARVALEEGASIVLTGYGRMSLVERVAKKLPGPAPVVALDVTSPDDLAALPDRVREHVDGVDGVLHSIGFAPASALGGGFLETPWDDVATAVPLLPERGGSIVGLTFDATVSWPGYDWMGVAKAGMESAARYLARELGPRGLRVNLVAAGPLRTMAARSIPGFAFFEDAWGGRAPLGWDISDPEPVARSCVALLSDWFPATTGEIVHADGGFHATGV